MDTHHVSIMYNNDGINRRYSESYKLKVLAELSTGSTTKQNVVNYTESIVLR